MSVDANFVRVILRNPREMTVDKNHTWDKMRFFKISHLSVTYKKNHSKMTRLTSLVIGLNLSHSPIDHSKDAKRRLENDPVTWVNEPLWNLKKSSKKWVETRSLSGYEIEHYYLSL